MGGAIWTSNVFVRTKTACQGKSPKTPDTSDGKERENDLIYSWSHDRRHLGRHVHVYGADQPGWAIGRASTVVILYWFFELT